VFRCRAPTGVPDRGEVASLIDLPEVIARCRLTEGPAKWWWEERPVPPAPAPDEVLVEVDHCGDLRIGHPHAARGLGRQNLAWWPATRFHRFQLPPLGEGVQGWGGRRVRVVGGTSTQVRSVSAAAAWKGSHRSARTVEGLDRRRNH